MNLILDLLAYSGGHTGEMIRLINGLDPKKFAPRLYLIANTDETSKKKVKDLEFTWFSRHEFDIKVC